MQDMARYEYRCRACGDTFELSTFKVMLYLNDVRMEQGPTCYIPGTHTDAALRRMTVVSASGDRPTARDARRFEFALVRRIASAQ